MIHFLDIFACIKTWENPQFFSTLTVWFIPFKNMVIEKIDSYTCSYTVATFDMHTSFNKQGNWKQLVVDFVHSFLF